MVLRSRKNGSKFNHFLLDKIVEPGPPAAAILADPKKPKKRLDAERGSGIIYLMKYDLTELAGELEDRPNCSNCFDEGIIDDDLDKICDCPEGEVHVRIMAEIDAEERAERMATDLSYWD